MCVCVQPSQQKARMTPSASDRNVTEKEMKKIKKERGGKEGHVRERKKSGRKLWGLRVTHAGLLTSTHTH